MSLVERFSAPSATPAPKAAVGANPNIAQLMAGTANACSASGCDSSPPVAVGMVLRSAAQGTPTPWPYIVPKGTKAYLTVALDVDFKGDDLMLSSGLDPAATPTQLQIGLNGLQITSWTSNGIRDQNLLAETGIPASAFDIRSLRRFGFDTAPTAARQQIVIEVSNPSPVDLTIQGLVAGVCGDCNTSNR